MSAAPTILIVDDEAETRETLAALLAEAGGYRVATCADAEQVEARVAAVRPALVLLDLMMPKRTGWEVLMALHARWPRLPVLIVSGAMGPREAAAFVATAQQRGARGYLSKPVESGALLTAAARALAPPGGG